MAWMKNFELLKRHPKKPISGRVKVLLKGNKRFHRMFHCAQRSITPCHGPLTGIPLSGRV